MTAEKTTRILRLQDGSIDYRYYAAKGLAAKNRETRIVAGKLARALSTAGHSVPVLSTVVLLVLIL